MDEIDNKTLVAAYKQLGGKLCLDFIKPSIRVIFLPIMHMKTQADVYKPADCFPIVGISGVAVSEEALSGIAGCGKKRVGCFCGDDCAVLYLAGGGGAVPHEYRKPPRGHVPVCADTDIDAV